jgi:hypothetical protein
LPSSIWERGVECRCACLEKLDAGGGDVVGRQRREERGLLAVDRDPCSARRQHDRPSCGGQQAVSERRAPVEDVFAVVQDHHQLLVEQVGQHLLSDVAAAEPQPQGVGDRRRHLVVREHRREVDEPHAVRTTSELGGTDRDRQPRLAGAARSQEGHPAVFAEQSADGDEVVVAPEQPGRPSRQVRGVPAADPERRELVLAELEEVHGADVAQLVNTEVLRRDARDQAHDVGEQHLAAMAGRLHTRRGVHHWSEVVVVSFLRLSEVQTHAHPQLRSRPLGRTEGALRPVGRRHRVGGA